MDEREKSLWRIVRAAQDVDAEARAALLDARCGGDAALRRDAQAALASIEQREHEDTDASMRAAGAAPTDDATRFRRDGTDHLIDTRLGPFRLVERIGRGGMGVVYRGTREGADFAQEVAIKLVRSGFDFDDVHARFLRERRILARLDHPNLARFIDGGVAPDGRPWFALEYVRGATLTRWCDERRLGLHERGRLFLEVCAAVQHAHAQLVVHRDLKPANILVDADGHVRLLDFGIARLLEGEDEGSATIAGRYAFTPEYAAPEQFGGSGVDNGWAGVATDVYALGVILYELIAGALPYALDRHDLVAAGRVVRDSPPLPLAGAMARDGDMQARLDARASTLRTYRAQTHGDLARILDKALAKEPARRYASVEAFADDLQRWLAGAPVRVSGNGLTYRIGKFVARNRVTVGFAALAALAALAGLATTTWQMRQTRLQRDDARAEAARANAVVDYLTLMFRDAADQAGAGAVTARDVLASGAKEIGRRFADEPATGRRVALRLAGLYARLGDTEGAAPLLEQVLAWPGIDADAEAQADARAQLAEIEYYRSHLPRARQLLDAARTFWSREPARYAKPLNESLITLSQLQRAQGHADEAVATLERAIEERRALLGQSDRVLALALNTLAVSLIHAGRYDDAVRRADEALAAFDKIEQKHSVAALSALSNRGTAALEAGRLADAERDLREAAQLRRQLYGPSPELAQVENSLGLALSRQGHLDAAIALYEGALKMAVERGGETTRYAMPARANLAEAYAAVGRIDDADRLAADAVRIAREQLGPDHLLLGTAERARAAVRITRGRSDEAKADLDDAARIFSAQGQGGVAQLATLAALREKLGTR